MTTTVESMTPDRASKAAGQMNPGRIDFALFVVIVLAAAMIGSWFTGSGIVKKFHFYQNEFAPAVMAACGHGFVVPSPEPVALTLFLELQADNFDCNAITPDQRKIDPDHFQLAHRNFMLTVATWWRALGVSWNSLSSLYGLAYGLSAGFAFLILRSAMGRTFAVALTCFFFLSPPQLFNLPHLRDYIKAPFMLAAIALLAWLLKGSIKRTQVVPIIAVLGLFIGTGVGFRIDLVVLVPLLVAAILFMQPGSLWESLKLRVLTAVVFIVCFSLAAGPILFGIKGMTSLSHVIVLGLMGEFDAKLGLNPAFYGLGYHYLDLYAQTVINSFAYASGYTGTTIPYPTPLYESTGMAYLVDVSKNLPADILARYISAIWRILHLPIEAPITFEDLYFFYDDYRPAWLMNIVHNRAWDLVLIGVIAGSTTLLASRSFKLLLSACLVIGYLCGYPFLQFDVRHYFYLEVIGLWMIGLCAQHLLLNPIAGWRERRQGQNGSASLTITPKLLAHGVLSGIGAILLVFCLPMALLAMLRNYQSSHLGTAIASYAASPTAPLAVEQVDVDGGWKALRVKRPIPTANRANVPVIETMQLVATFDSRVCKKDGVHVRVKYNFDAATYDFTRTRSVAIDANTRMFFPAFFQSNLSAFSGIEMPAEDFGCLKSIERVVAAPPFRFPLEMFLPQNWLSLPRYRTLTSNPLGMMTSN